MARSNKKTAPRKPRQKNPAKASVKATVLTQSARPAKPLFRLIPLTITAASALLCMKTIEIYQTGRAIQQELFISSVLAEETASEPAKEAEEKTAEKPDEKPAEETPAEGATAESKPAEEGAPADGTPAEAVVEAPPKDWVEEHTNTYNQRELDVLESLSTRREKLDQWEKDVALREKVLKATEERIEQKLAELNGMSKELKDLLVTHDKEEDAKISSLVKVYESMKPKDAARIFDELDMDILLLVVDRMSERRVAPVLAAMSPQKAKEVTQQLADQQKGKPTEPAPDDSYSPPLF